MIHKRILIFLLAILFTFLTNGQNALVIPDTLSGSNITLTVQAGTKQFFGSNNTPTYGYNGNFLGPTLMINKWDTITLNVKNTLTVATTVHWHGLHVSPKDDGGPHQIILPNSTWSPSFRMRNEAATFWYHPHGVMKTEIQVTRGLAGFIIVRDSTERNYNLPRRYKIDDFPLVIQSKAFDVLYQFATATHEDSILMVNGTTKPYLQVPKQIVRFRLLNGSADRTYNFGLSNNSTFYLIGSDGGLLSQPLSTNRVRLSPGERAEILVNFSTYTIGTQLYLKSYSSELPKGVIGADSVGTSSLVISEGYYSNWLNGADFNVLRFDVINPTSNPVTTIPSVFNPKTPLSEIGTNAYRHIHFSADTAFSGQQGKVDGPFLMNNTPFNMDSINLKTLLNNKEVWKLSNSTMVAHPFHIHDVQFYILDINGLPPPPQYQGLKDVILVLPKDTIRFITKFTTFADNNVPYMYHCHLLHHEDDGMMHSFLVQDPNSIGIKEFQKTNNSIKVYPNPSNNIVNFYTDQNEMINKIKMYDILGQEIISNNDINTTSYHINITQLPIGVYNCTIQTEKNFYKVKIIKT